MLSWLLHVLENCNARSYAINRGRMVRLAEYSRNVLREDTAVLARDSMTFEVLDRDGCLRVEPGLAAAAQRVAGGLRLPGDETGHCFKFTSNWQIYVRIRMVIPGLRYPKDVLAHSHCLQIKFGACAPTKMPERTKPPCQKGDRPTTASPR